MTSVCLDEENDKLIICYSEIPECVCLTKHKICQSVDRVRRATSAFKEFQLRDERLLDWTLLDFLIKIPGQQSVIKHLIFIKCSKEFSVRYGLMDLCNLMIATLEDESRLMPHLIDVMSYLPESEAIRKLHSTFKRIQT